MNKQKRKKRGKKSVQNLLGLQGFTTYGLKTTGGELVYFAIQPTNISVLSHVNIEIKIRHLLMVLTALPHLEVALSGLRPALRRQPAIHGEPHPSGG